MGLAADVVANLEARGWNVSERSGTSGRADGIVVEYSNTDSFTDDAGLDQIFFRELEPVLFGGADPRGEDIAVGY